MQLPSLYTPNQPSEFIGPAAETARLITNAVKAALENDNAPIKVLLNGDPGIGKSALAKYMINLLGSDLKFSVTKLSGTSVKIDQVEDLAQSLWYRDMFGGYRVIWIEEADAIPTVAQTRFLMLMDDLPNACAVICTSNCKIKDFIFRFQRRFKVYEVEAPQPHEIAGLLKRYLTDPIAINQISSLACGCVAQALMDAEAALQAA